MQRTSQTRLSLDAASAARLVEMAEFQAKYAHKLYAVIAARGGNARSHKTEFCRTHGVASRFFTVIASEVQGLIDGTRELLKARLDDVQRNFKSTQRSLAAANKKLKDIADVKLHLAKVAYEALVQRAHKLRLRQTRLTNQEVALKGRLAAHVPGIGFGSRKLFVKQFHLEENGYANHAEWLVDWREARAHQVNFIGSKDETGGNQACAVFVQFDGSFSLRVRIPDALLGADEDKYLWLRGLRFHHAEHELRAAIEAGQALTWRLHRRNGHWRALVSFDRAAAPVTTRQAMYGTVGVDFNVDHLAVAETDPCGNVLRAWREDLPFEAKTTGQRNAILSDALQRVVQHAHAARKPLVIEDLDFRGKKRDMAQMSPAQARMLSGLAYAKYQQIVASKCDRAGVELLKINPAYTSVIGRIKYAVAEGRSVHQAAAGTIARRGQGFGEKPPRSGAAMRIPANGRVQRFPVPARKAGTTRDRAWAAIAKDLQAFLRKDYLATRAAASPPLVGAKGRNSGVQSSGPSSVTVALRADSPMRLLTHEQVCVSSI